MAEPITREQRKEIELFIDGEIRYYSKGYKHDMFCALRLLLTDHQEWPYCDLCAKVVEAKGGKLVDRKDIPHESVIVSNLLTVKRHLTIAGLWQNRWDKTWSYLCNKKE